MNRPYISIIIPTYNRAHLINRAIESVLNQTYGKFELLVVDDCSNDDTESVVSSFDDFRIRYIKCDKNGGAAAARNRGIKEAKYDWIAFLDSDDVWRTDKLEKQVTAMDGVAGLVYCTFLRHPSDGTEDTLMPSSDRSVDRRQGIMFGELLLGNFIGMPTIMVHKSVFNDAGLFDENLRCYEDYDFLLRASQYTRFLHVDEVLVDVYETEGSVGLNPDRFFEAITKILAQYKSVYEEINFWQTKVEWLLGIAETFGMKEKIENLLEERILEYTNSD